MLESRGYVFSKSSLDTPQMASRSTMVDKPDSRLMWTYYWSSENRWWSIHASRGRWRPRRQRWNVSGFELSGWTEERTVRLVVKQSKPWHPDHAPLWRFQLRCRRFPRALNSWVPRRFATWASLMGGYNTSRPADESWDQTNDDLFD